MLKKEQLMKKKLTLDQSKLLGFKIFAKDCGKNLTPIYAKDEKITISTLMGAKVGKIGKGG
jgi:hypothetical protein